MDAISVLIALVAFTLLLAAIEAADRVWAAPTCSGWWCRWPSSPTCCTRCCARSGS